MYDNTIVMIQFNSSVTVVVRWMCSTNAFTSCQRPCASVIIKIVPS